MGSQHRLAARARNTGSQHRLTAQARSTGSQHRLAARAHNTGSQHGSRQTTTMTMLESRALASKR
eukprot:13299114-Heterocapsa_arctica.AAC.1